jgi:hypothetical protein
MCGVGLLLGMPGGWIEKQMRPPPCTTSLASDALSAAEAETAKTSANEKTAMMK